MDFSELEASEGLRWSWHSWPASKPEVSSLVLPLSIMATPLMQFNELPILPYDPLKCLECSAVLNPYSRVDYTSKIWFCSFCSRKNPFPLSYAHINESNIPAELFPTYSTVEYHLGLGTGSVMASGPVRSPSGSFSSSLATYSGQGFGSEAANLRIGPAFVFVVDCCSSEVELRALKSELLLIVTQLPANALVGLVAFDSMVRVYDIGFTDCQKVVLLHGERNITLEQVKSFLGINLMKQYNGNASSMQKQGFLVRVSEYEFNITSAIDDINSTALLKPGNRPLRCTGVAISVAVGLLEACSINTGARIMLFTSGPATLGPGMIVDSYLTNSIRTHRDLDNGYASSNYKKCCKFYEEISRRLCESSIVLDLFACALDQVGASEMKCPVESSGGFMMLGDSFESDEFRKCIRHMFSLDGNGNLNMFFDATIEIVTTKGLKICGALGPCVSLKRKNETVSETVIGSGGTNIWKLSTLTNKTTICFFFEIGNQPKAQPASAFFIQIKTNYRYGNMERRKRVTTVARRWVVKNSPEIISGFDQEAAAAVIARLAIHKLQIDFSHEVVKWLDKMLIRFVSKFGDYAPEDPSSFRLSANFSLYPQFMYYLRRSQFIDVFNSTPDETAYFRLMLNREGVVNSLIMVQPTLFKYSFEGPPMPVVLDICSITPDVILLFDSFFYVVVHYGSKIAQFRKNGYHNDPNHETFKKLLEAPVVDAQQLVTERYPVPKIIECDQHSSQARFLLAKLNPSVTYKSDHIEGKEIVFTDDVSLQAFIEHLQELAVQG